MQQQADRGLFIKKWMCDLLLFALLLGNEHGLSRRIVHLNGTAFTDRKIAGLDLLSINEREYQAIRQKWAEFFHQIQRHAWATGTIT